MKSTFPFHARRWWPVVVSVLLGANLGLFIHGCWLIAIFPADGAWLLAATLFASALGSVGYFFFLQWTRDHWTRPAENRQIPFAASSLLAGLFLFSTLLDCARQPSHYISFFLPNHVMQISILSPNSTPVDISILHFETSLGEVPFSDLAYRGWEVRDERLVLTGAAGANELRWSGKAGQEARITFESASQEGQAVIVLDGREKTFPLAARKYVHSSSFEVPFFASLAWILALGLLNVLALSVPSIRLGWKKQSELARLIVPLFSGSVARFSAADWGTLLGSILLAALLRIPNLNMWFLLGVDEYSHLNAAKWIIANASLNADYQRSLWMVTLPVSLAFRLGGQALWAARLAGVIFNVAALIPLYLVTRRVNREVAALAVFLYAASPWTIIFSRIIREYAYHPFYFLWIVYGMILLLEKIPFQFRIRSDWKKALSPSIVTLAALLCLPPIYALSVDPQSTFKLILLAYFVFGFLFLSKLDLRDRGNLIFLAGAAFILSAALYAWRSQIAPAGLALGFHSTPLGYFLPRSPQQWFFQRIDILPTVGLLAALSAGFLIRRERPIPFFFALLFAACLGFFVFSNNLFFSPRHLMIAQLWYIILMAIGFFLVWIMLKAILPFRNGAAMTAALLALALFTFNFRHMVSPSFSRDSLELVTEDYYYDLREIQSLLQARADAHDVLISTTPYARHAAWMETPQFSSVHLFPVYVAAEDILALARQYPSGWIVMDQTRIDATEFSPFEAFSEAGINFEGLFGDEYVWHWNTESAPPLP